MIYLLTYTYLREEDDGESWGGGVMEFSTIHNLLILFYIKTVYMYIAKEKWSKMSIYKMIIRERGKVVNEERIPLLLFACLI